jgi:hypothetical protein
VLLVVALAANAALVLGGLEPYGTGLALQAGFYAAAALGALARGGLGVAGRLLAIPYAFCLLNATALVAIVRFVRGAYSVTWDRVDVSPVVDDGPRAATRA